jgi:protein O-mannosyl-transferase
MTDQLKPESEPAAWNSGSSLKSQSAWLIASLVVLTGVVYWPVHSFEFVNWDDTWYVLKNEYIRSWHPSNLWDIATQVINRNYSPMIIFTLLVEHTLFGIEPAGYHVFNVLLHMLNAALVFVLVSRLAKSQSVGWATAAFFAIHPVQLESVAWVSSVKGLVCGAFILAHLICVMRPERTPKQELWGLVFFAFAILSKALTVVIPAIVFLYDVLVCRKKFSESLARQFIPGMLSLWILLMTMGAQASELGGVRDHMSLGKLHILAVDSIILWNYVAMLLCPRQLSVLYNPATTGIAAQVAVASVLWAIVGFACWKVRKSHPFVPLAAASFFLLLLPVLNLTSITTLMNDRYLYMPSIPFFAMVCFGVKWSCERLDAWRAARSKRCDTTIRPTVCGGWIGIPLAATIPLVVATYEHLPVWQNDQALWENTIARTPGLPLVHIQYAWMLHNSGHREDAIARLRHTLTEMTPDELDRARIEQTIEDWSPGSEVM